MTLYTFTTIDKKRVVCVKKPLREALAAIDADKKRHPFARYTGFLTFNDEVKK